ncbi:unnamed protein product [Durusdinium trenchii]|uniref:EF-hand domain-containing protein n=1 Tax=Durusdinium trenchii TaxID=1381693 RepID=A0ABP0K565_9DINO
MSVGGLICHVARSSEKRCPCIFAWSKLAPGGTLALQSALSFPHALAGVCSIAGWASAGLMPSKAETSELPIFMSHGHDDRMVPIEVARNSCSALAALGYKKVSLMTFKGLRHQLSTLQFKEIMEFYRQVIPERVEGFRIPSVVTPKPAGCILWMHDASIVGNLDEHDLATRLHKSLPGVQLVLRGLPQVPEGESLGRLLLQEITEQLKKVAWELWELGQLNRQRDISADTTTSSFAVLNEEVAGRWVIPGVCPRQCLVVSVRVALLPSWGFSIHSWQASCPVLLSLPMAFPSNKQNLERTASSSSRMESRIKEPPDKVVPIDAARHQWRSLETYGYRGEAWLNGQSLFLLLDIDDQGYIDVEEFIAGCCRIHGPAKAIDLTTLMCQVRKLHMELREHALWVVECMTMAGFASPASTFQGSPRHRRKPSFGLTAHPDHALEEKSPVASLDHKVHASPASSIEQAPEALSALTPAGSLKLPINNRLHDEGFGGFASSLGVFALLATLAKNRSCSGISRSTQILYFLVFVTRYLDLIDEQQAFYLVFFKITYIVTSIIVLAVFYKLDATYERQKDTCSLAVILVPCFLGAFLLAKTYQLVDILWTFSQFCEGFAMVPQYVFCYRDRMAKDIGVTFYVLSMGAYRCFYAANWIYKKVQVPKYTDFQSWLGGLIDILFFADYLLSFTGLSLLRSMVLKVDEKINEFKDKVEMKVLGSSSSVARDSQATGTELRQRRKADEAEEDIGI